MRSNRMSDLDVDPSPLLFAELDKIFFTLGFVVAGGREQIGSILQHFREVALPAEGQVAYAVHAIHTPEET